MYLPIILAMVLYPVLAVLFVRFVWKRTSRKILRGLAIAFAILLPSWDAVLSAAFFYTACPFYSKAEIYETVDVDGIYYEGGMRDTVFTRIGWEGKEVNRLLLADEDFRRGYSFMESRVTKHKSYEKEIMTVSPPAYYRCVEGPRDTQRPSEIFAQCMPVAEISSNYVVRSEIMKVALIELEIMNISERSTSRLMAEYRAIVKHPYAGAPFYPFFTWLSWHGGMFKANEYVSCPQKKKFYSFQYEVLKVKK